MLPGAFAQFGAVVAGGCLATLAAVAVHAWRETRSDRLANHWAIAQTAAVLLAVVALNETAIAGGMIQQLSQVVGVAALVLVAALVAAPTRAGGWLWVIASWVAIGLPGALGFIGVRAIGDGLLVAHPIWFGVAAIAYLALVARVVAIGWWSAARPPASQTSMAGPGLPAAGLVVLAAISFAAGLAPGAIRDRLKIAAHHVASHISASDSTAAECDTVPTPEQLSASPGSQFLLAVPCGPDGEPLAAPSTPR
jgi:formate hydrogenlyase subunit 3/multisubunit Na+/H+ antiporter MnhD subunit